ADTYTMQVARDEGFTDLVIDMKNLRANRLLSPQSLPNNTQLYWRVSAANESGSGPLSDVWSFITIDTLAAPVLIAPPDASVQPSQGIAFSWHAVNGADGYELEVMGPSGGSDGTQADTVAIRDLEEGATYQWRARAWRGPLAGPWSVEWTFTTELPLPGTVTLLEPGEDNVAIDIPQLFRWTATGPQVDRYWLEYAIDEQFQMNVFRDSSLSATEALLSIELATDTDFWWRVRAGNPTGWGPWSSSRRNRYILTGAGPVLSSPTTVELSPVYPNPVGMAGNTSTIVRYTLPRATVATLEVRDLLGRRIVLLDQGFRAAGRHRFTLESTTLPSGHYILILRAGNVLRSQSLLVIR
ncbi:MAG: T9SS type A sorting domain-containing protein, partial [Bacteroidetes bacterium]|nr:T9SS type A sorting domain-containing protein [Bacteroidota bacterium]